MVTLLKKSVLLVCVLGAWLVASDARAVSITGRITGAVVDPTGLPVEGALVEVTSPNLIGKNRTAKTNAEGEFRFSDLPPGAYSVTVKSEGFRDTRQEGVSVSVGQTAQLDVVLEPPVAATQEAYVVTARKTMVDTESTQVGQTINQSFTSRVYTQRDYQGIATLLPGVQDSGSDSKSDGNPSIHGANGQSNQYLLDGINMTDPVTNTFSRNFNFDAIEDVEVLTGGTDAEYGGATGGTINVVTKSGSNKFVVDASLYYEPDTTPLRSGKYLSKLQNAVPGQVWPYRGEDGLRRYSSQEASLLVSGPIIKDKLWFMFSGQLSFNQSSLAERVFPGYDLAPREFRAFFGLGKLTWQATPWQRFQLLVQGDPTSLANTTQLNTTRSDAETNQQQGGGLLMLSSDTNLGEHVLLKNKFGFFSSYIQTAPQSGDFDTPGHVNGSTGTATVNDTRLYRDNRNRFQFSPQLVINWDRVLGTHESKLGMDASFAWQQVYDSIPGGRSYVDQGVPTDPNQIGAPDYETRLLKAQNALISGDNIGLYVQDVWKPFKFLTLRPGLRFESSRMRNDHASPSSLMQSNKDNGMAKTVQEFFDATIIHFNILTPRLGFAWDPFNDGKTNIHGGYFRYSDPGYLEFPSTVGRSTSTRRYNYNPATGKYDIPAGDSGGESGFKVKSELSGFNPTRLPSTSDVDFSRPWAPRVQGWAPLQFLTGEHVTKADELVLGATRELIESVSLTVDGVFRYYSNLYEDDETNLIWNKDGSNVVDGKNGKKDVVYSLGTPDAAYQTYYGFDVTLKKALTDKFEGQINYTFGVNRGTTDFPFSVAFDREKQFPYLFGFMALDRRHMLKIIGYYHLPYGFVVGATFSYLSGQPYNKYFKNEFYSDYNDLRARRGYDPDHPDRELRMPDQVRANTRVMWDAEELTGQKFWLIADVTNVLNLRTPTELETRDLAPGSPTKFGDVTDRRQPISLTLGMRFQY